MARRGEAHLFMQNMLPDTQAAVFWMNVNKATREVTQKGTRSNLMAVLYVIFFFCAGTNVSLRFRQQA